MLGKTQWLEYRHWVRGVGDTYISDLCAYNGDSSHTRAHWVRDIMLVMDVTVLSGPGHVEIELTDGTRRFLIHFGLQRANAWVQEGRLSLRSLHRHSDEEVTERLTSVWGIGEWSAQMFLLFHLGRLDVFAPGDLGLQEGIRVLDGLETRPTPTQALERAEVWHPLRSVASWYLWRLVDGGGA